MAKCTICNKTIVLVPSASERAAKFGGKASDYTKMFTTHSECAVAKRSQESTELMRRIVAEQAANKVQIVLA